MKIGSKIKAIVIAFFILVSEQIMSQELLPAGCSALVIPDERLALDANKHTFVMLHNISNSDVWIINKENVSGFASSIIHPNHWSALVLNNSVKEVKFSCVESRPGHEQQTSCHDVLAACYWPLAKIPEQKKNTGFVVEDIDLSSLTAYIARLGFVVS